MNGSGAGLQFDTLHSCPFQNRLFPSNRLGCSKKRNENQQSAVLQCSSKIHTFQMAFSSTFSRPESPMGTPSVSAARVIQICRTRAVGGPYAWHETIARMNSHRFHASSVLERPAIFPKTGLIPHVYSLFMQFPLLFGQF